MFPHSSRFPVWFICQSRAFFYYFCWDFWNALKGFESRLILIRLSNWTYQYKLRREDFCFSILPFRLNKWITSAQGLKTVTIKCISIWEYLGFTVLFITFFKNSFLTLKAIMLLVTESFPGNWNLRLCFCKRCLIVLFLWSITLNQLFFVFEVRGKPKFAR